MRLDIDPGRIADVLKIYEKFHTSKALQDLDSSERFRVAAYLTIAYCAGATNKFESERVCSGCKLPCPDPRAEKCPACGADIVFAVTAGRSR